MITAIGGVVAVVYPLVETHLIVKQLQKDVKVQGKWLKAIAKKLDVELESEE